MPAKNDSLLREVFDRYSRQMAEGLHAEGGALKASIDTRLIDEASAERRKLLTNLSTRIESTWSEFCVAFHESLMQDTLMRAGLLDDQSPSMIGDLSGLSLVDDDQMEVDIALAGVGSRCLGAAGEALSEVEMRLATLYEEKIADESGPFDSSVLVAALKQGFERTMPEAEYRRGLLRWLDPVLARVVAQQFTTLNAWLQEQGIEPAVRVRSAGPARAPGVPGATPTDKAPVGGNSSGGGSGGGGGQHVPEDVCGTLQQFVQSAPAGGEGQVGGFVPGAGMAVVPTAMLESLNRLQSLDLSAIQSGTVDAAPGTNVLRELRQHDSVGCLPPIEAITIDIVATLFDFIFDDPMVPDSVKALVGRLQIPLLKVAMIDKTFFSHKEHPARALLNEISRVSVAAGKNLPQDSPIFEKIKSAVNRVLSEFQDDDQKVFGDLVAELHELVVKQDARDEEITEKTKDHAEKQEQNDIAESKAGDAFSRILDAGLPPEVPSHIGDFLARKYPLILKRALQNGGVQGPAWAIAAQTLTDLLWTLTMKDTLEERQRMVQMLPDLLRRVNAFFDKVGVTAEEKVPFMDALVQQHSNVIKGTRRNAERRAKAEKAAQEAKGISAPLKLKPGVVASENMSPTVVVTRVVQENGIEIESMTVSGELMNRKPMRTEEAEQIKRGEWVEFIADTGKVTRARLSWVSPYRGVMLFTNPESSRAISVSTEALALQLRQSQAKVLGAEPMVDRAISCTLDSKKAA